jgi:hypothetical protein
MNFSLYCQPHPKSLNFNSLGTSHAGSSSFGEENLGKLSGSQAFLLSQSSKLLAFLSLQMHHIKYRKVILQTSKIQRLSTANNFTTYA